MLKIKRYLVEIYIRQYLYNYPIPNKQLINNLQHLVPTIIVKVIEVKINPGFIPFSVDCFKIGVHEKRNIFKQAKVIPSINPMHNTSTFLNSLIVSFIWFKIEYLLVNKRSFSSQYIFIAINDEILKKILTQKGA